MSEFFPKANIKHPQRGDLLISEPFLADPNFERTVVLLCEHSEEGSFGFVLNKPGLLKLGDVMDELDPFNADLFIGGPVDHNTAHFLHRIPEILVGGQEVAPGVVWGGDFEQFSLMAQTGQLHDHDFRFFIGYSGWGSGQLEGELEQNSWVVFRGVNQRHVFELAHDQLWRQVLEEMGGKYKMFANYPVDPRLN